MISKELFCECLNNIKKQKEIDEEIAHALGKRCEGYDIMFGCTDYCRDSLIKLLKETMNDNYDYIGWWLWETDTFIVYNESATSRIEYDLHTPEALYDYLIEYQEEDEK